jgi:hypothetical protein
MIDLPIELVRHYREEADRVRGAPPDPRKGRSRYRALLCGGSTFAVVYSAARFGVNSSGNPL